MTQWIHNYDIIFLCETATNVVFSVPGYHVITGKTTVPNRGGVVILVKNYLYEYITAVDITVNDQIWFAFSFMPSVLFGGCYIPPSDSRYYDVHAFSSIVSKRMDNAPKSLCLFGDFNCRFGNDLSLLNNADKDLSYVPIDPIIRPNSNGAVLLPLLSRNELFVLNNLVYSGVHFKGKLTYREGIRWISELDLFIMSLDIVPAVVNFSVDQNLEVPSDHAPVAITLDISSLCDVSSPALVSRASQLGDHAVLHRSTEARGERPDGLCRRRPLCPDNIDHIPFQQALQNCDPVALIDLENSNDDAIKSFCDNLYDFAKLNPHHQVPQGEDEHNEDEVPYTTSAASRRRWQRIMRSSDDKALWKAINWQGSVDECTGDSPPDCDFKTHLETITNPENTEELNPNDYNTNVYVPVLDSPIQAHEVSYVIEKQIKPNKSAGIDGICPSLFKYLPIQWILVLTVILNCIFWSGYPVCWTYSRLKMLFKKGSRLSCDNYRGISIIDCMSKVYDYVLYNRLVQWFKPDKEQVGAQPKRGCVEHIVTLRLIMDFCFRRKKKLFIAFVDFSKAYDRVPRDKMMETLKRVGCGFVMLFAIASMYKVTKSILGTAIISATIGVRQGSPTSCFLFVLFVNTLIRMIKERCPRDGFLGWLHVLMLMDDTVILATSRECLMSKLNILCDFCSSHGMVINEGKTKFMAVNGNDEERRCINIQGLAVDHCKSYVYLGAVFTSDGSVKSSLEEHCRQRLNCFHKLIIFLKTNVDMPFCAKRKVVEACFNASILYGCESWIGVSCQMVDKMYIGALKCLLGVRKTTANDLCLVELGVPPLQALVKQRQHDFFVKMNSEKNGAVDEPFNFAMDLTRDYNTRTSKQLDSVIQCDDHVGSAVNVLKNRIRNSDRTKFVTYRTINPTLDMHAVYSHRKRENFIDEYHRLSFSRLRLSSHNLKIETGRWSRQPRELRLCVCGQVQDEMHVIQFCPLTERFRYFHPTPVTFPGTLIESRTRRDFKLIHDMLNVY